MTQTFFPPQTEMPDPKEFTTTLSELDGTTPVFVLWYAVATLASEQLSGFMHGDHFAPDPDGNEMGVGMRTYTNIATVALPELPTTPEGWTEIGNNVAMNLSLALKQDPLFPRNSRVEGASAMLLNEEFNVSRKPNAKPMVMSITGQPEAHKTVQ